MDSSRRCKSRQSVAQHALIEVSVTTGLPSHPHAARPAAIANRGVGREHAKSQEDGEQIGQGLAILFISGDVPVSQKNVVCDLMGKCRHEQHGIR